MIRDTEFFKSRISKIEGAADIGDHLVSIVKAKAVAEQPKPATEPPPKKDEPAEKPQQTDAEDKT